MMVFSGRIFSTISRAITCRETGGVGCVILALFYYGGMVGDGEDRREISCASTKQKLHVCGQRSHLTEL